MTLDLLTRLFTLVLLVALIILLVINQVKIKRINQKAKEISDKLRELK